jgi:hypothetical protein
MTDKTQVVTFTPEERAILDGTSTVKVEDASEPVSEELPGGPEVRPEGSEPEGGKGKDGDTEGGEEAEGEEEEVTEVADGTNPDAPARRKVIAFSAYEKQRQAKKALAEEVTKLREQVAYVTGLAQNAPKPQQQAPQQTEELSLTPPDKTKEPEKYLAWLETAAAKALQFEQRTNQQSEQSSRFQQINDAVYAHEQAFIKGDPESGTEAHPDFLEAVAFLRDKQTKELKAAGYEQHEINQILVARAQDVSLRALKANDSPAKRVYSLAKLNGYKAAQPKPAETEAEKIARQAKSQEKAGKTISALPGGEAKGGLTAESLANMDPAQFKKLWDSGEAKALMGWKD